MTLSRLKLYKGDVQNGLVESFAGFTDLTIPTPAVPEDAKYVGVNVNVANGDEGFLTFDAQVGGSPLLTFAAPSTPTFTEPGVYALTVRVKGDALTAAGSAAVTIVPPFTGGVGGGFTTRPELNGFGTSCVFAAGVDDHVRVKVNNFDGASARDFNLALALLVKIAGL